MTLLHAIVITLLYPYRGFTMLNKYSTVPLYYQLKNILLEQIKSGEFAAGMKIPSEDELCTQYKISRPTVRQAIGELTSSGFLIKEKGKGTYVSQSKSIIDLKKYNGFIDSIIDGDSITTRNILSCEKISSKDNLFLKQNFQLTDSHTYEFAKTDYIQEGGDCVLSICTSYVPLILFPDIIDDIKLKKRPQEIMKGKYPYVPSKAKLYLELEFASSEQAEQLQIQAGFPLIKITSILQAKTGNTVEVIIACYRTDKCRLYFDDLK